VQITSQPESLEKPTGESASFTVVAKYAQSYAWEYRNGASGQWTTPSSTPNYSPLYYIPSVADRHNGYQFRCKITNGQGEVYSDIATLTVT
jgi:hypothetical protein